MNPVIARPGELNQIKHSFVEWKIVNILGSRDVFDDPGVFRKKLVEFRLKGIGGCQVLSPGGHRDEDDPRVSFAL